MIHREGNVEEKQSKVILVAKNSSMLRAAKARRGIIWVRRGGDQLNTVVTTPQRPREARCCRD